MKYLGIIMDHKFIFKEHIKYVAERCTKLIYNLSMSAKLTWGIIREALKNISNNVPLFKFLLRKLLLQYAFYSVDEYYQQNFNDCVY